LQFLEQRDKKRQADLVKTVLGQLLHFDKYVPSPISPPHLPSLGGPVMMKDYANNSAGKTRRDG